MAVAPELAFAAMEVDDDESFFDNERLFDAHDGGAEAEAEDGEREEEEEGEAEEADDEAEDDLHAEEDDAARRRRADFWARAKAAVGSGGRSSKPHKNTKNPAANAVRREQDCTKKIVHELSLRADIKIKILNRVILSLNAKEREELRSLGAVHPTHTQHNQPTYPFNHIMHNSPYTHARTNAPPRDTVSPNHPPSTVYPSTCHHSSSHANLPTNTAWRQVQQEIYLATRDTVAYLDTHCFTALNSIDLRACEALPISTMLRIRERLACGPDGKRLVICRPPSSSGKDNPLMRRHNRELGIKYEDKAVFVPYTFKSPAQIRVAANKVSRMPPILTSLIHYIHTTGARRAHAPSRTRFRRRGMGRLRDGA